MQIRNDIDIMLKSAMRKKNINASQLSELAGKNKNTTTKYLTPGNKNIMLSTLLDYMNVLELEGEDLLNKSNVTIPEVKKLINKLTM